MPDENEEHHRRIAREAAEEAVHQTLEVLGIDVHNPRQAQADFQALRWIREARDKGVAALIWTAVSLMVGGILALIWDAVAKGGK